MQRLKKNLFVSPRVKLCGCFQMLQEVEEEDPMGYYGLEIVFFSMLMEFVSFVQNGGPPYLASFRQAKADRPDYIYPPLKLAYDGVVPWCVCVLGISFVCLD